MRDPHVEQLHYTLGVEERRDYVDPPPVERETDAFRIHLEDGHLTVEMQEHHATEESAREVVEPYLKAWSLLTGQGNIWFDYDRAEIVDRDAPEPENGELSVKEYVHITDDVYIDIKASEYPAPPEGISVSDTLNSMLDVYRTYEDGGRSIGGMGGHCLSILDGSFDGRDDWRRKLNVASTVVNRLGYLTAEVGDVTTGRKLGREPRPHTGAEKKWIKAVVRTLMERLGRYEVDPDQELVQITMEDFPPLD